MMSHLVKRSDGYTETVCGKCGAKTVLRTTATDELLDRSPRYIVCTGVDVSGNRSSGRGGCNAFIGRRDLASGAWNPLLRRRA